MPVKIMHMSGERELEKQYDFTEEAPYSIHT